MQQNGDQAVQPGCPLDVGEAQQMAYCWTVCGQDHTLSVRQRCHHMSKMSKEWCGEWGELDLWLDQGLMVCLKAG